MSGSERGEECLRFAIADEVLLAVALFVENADCLLDWELRAFDGSDQVGV
jgi:hypothetical protein